MRNKLRAIFNVLRGRPVMYRMALAEFPRTTSQGALIAECVFGEFDPAPHSDRAVERWPWSDPDLFTLRA